MRRLSPVPDDPIGVYDKVIAGKHEPRRSRLQTLRQCVEAAYTNYDRMKPALEGLQAISLSKEQREDLLHCYSGSTNDDRSSTYRNRIYAKILALASTCPYCTASSVATLDHYLSKEYYPEFSSLTINLLPSCSRCNTPRDFKNSTGERALIHPYFDSIPRDRLLTATITVDKGALDVSFSIDASQCSDADFARLYESHVLLLGLLDRYRRKAMSDDGGLADTVATVRALDADNGDAAAFLRRQADNYEIIWGANNFKTALTRGAAASREFLDYCLGGAP